MSDKTIETVFTEYHDTIMALPNVAGISIGIHNNKPCIRIFVTHKTKKLLNKIPNTLDKYPVVVQKTGEFRTL